MAWMNDSYKLYLEGRELLGECFLLLGRPQQAIVPLAAATTLNPQVRAPSLLAQAFLECGQYQRAVEMATAVLAKAPTNRIALDILAREGIRHAVP